ncbi:BIG/ATPase V1 complex, subunit S1 [Exophiala viscosa]|uniref:Protein BIG1 n=1 Tax=Exophiala viscosa TaxID=2486360 RepID=A0AAN6E0Y8_9EURO|nr:BIG/ATPase V1 complex, subunit S1 [Exophiala viscosa]
MHLLGLCALALATGCAHGYLDTTPFFMFSTSELLNPDSRLQSADSLVSNVAISLSSCPSEYYILISQHGVSGRDYTSMKSTPVLAKAVSERPSTGIRSSIIVPDVAGTIDSSSWIETLKTKCGVQVTDIDASTGAIPAQMPPSPHVLKVSFPAPSSSTKQPDLSSNDAFFASILDLLPSQKYTVLYTTTRAKHSGFMATQVEKTEYEMESQIQDAMHSDLKRDLSARASNQTENHLIDGPLFHRYQFFTPGIFMGFLVGLLLLSILYVGISALASLQVTYAAFDKETSQLGQKKQ